MRTAVYTVYNRGAEALAEYIIMNFETQEKAAKYFGLNVQQLNRWLHNPIIPQTETIILLYSKEKTLQPSLWMQKIKPREIAFEGFEGPKKRTKK